MNEFQYQDRPWPNHYETGKLKTSEIFFLRRNIFSCFDLFLDTDLIQSDSQFKLHIEMKMKR